VTVDDTVASHLEPRPEARAAWDAGRSPGHLIVAWQHPDTRLIAPVGLLEHGSAYRYRYLKRARIVEGFQPFVSFPDWERSYVSDTLFPVFAQRIMSPRRPDFSRFLRQLDLREGATPWEQLARSEGRSSGDTIQVFPIPYIRPDGATTCRFLVHGIRHVNGGHLPTLHRGDALGLSDEPGNQHNARAVRVCSAGGRPVGYVPDLLLQHLQVIRATAPVSLVVEHVNGREVPPHLRLLVRLDGHGPPGYQPMAGPDWETLAE
jgi:HIRAN domain